MTAEIETRLSSLVAKLSLEQKVRLLTGADWWALHPEPAVGLRTMVVSDGPVGVRGRVHDDTDPSANLPSASAIAATWDLSLVARLARLLAAEARRKGVDVVLGPTVNLHRSPRGGRHFESYSEDPLLTGWLGVAYVRALQSGGVGATPKHYVANDSETERLTVDVRVDERTLREVYLRPFEDIVRQAGPWLVMAAYNSVNGTTMTENPLLAEPLKGEWGFDGVVVSDWFAARSTVAAGNAALDLVMPVDRSPWVDDLVAAVRDGAVSEAAVDEKVLRLLRLAERVGALDRPPAPAPAVTAEHTAALLREAAAAGMVLVANRDNVLPLDAGAQIAVIGPHAERVRSQGGGSAEVHPAYTVSPLEGLQAVLAGRAEVVYERGMRLDEGLVPVEPSLATNPVTGRPGVRVELLDVDGNVLRADHRRGGNLRYTTSGDLVPGAVTLRASTRLRVDMAGTWRLGAAGIGHTTITIDGELVIDDGFFPEGLDMTSAWADPPQLTVPRDLVAGEEVDVVLTYDLRQPDMAATVCILGYERPAADRETELAAAVAAAREADVAVVVVGTTERVESEGFDRTSLALPSGQDELVSAVAAANPRTVVVVNAGSPVLMPWRDQVAAVLLAWFGGQEMGNAVADVLLGLVEPGGRLPTTWPATQEQVPVLDTTPVGGRLEYTEGLHIGYRAWLRAGAQPAYPFGFGLGYTSWEYQRVEVDGARVSVTVRNTGQRAGREVVQAYLSRSDSTVERPARWLAGFAAVHAEPGEVVTVEVPLDTRAFAYWSVEQQAWVDEPGPFTLLAGGCVTDTPLTATISAAGPTG